MLYMIKCNLMHPLYISLPVPYVPVRVTRGALVAHRYTNVLQDFCSILSVSVKRSCCSAFDGAGLAGFKSRANAFLLA